MSGVQAEWIPVMVPNWFPETTFQLDHYHLKVGLRKLAADPARAGRRISWALARQWRRISAP
jgi:hypothetical protein